MIRHSPYLSPIEISLDAEVYNITQRPNLASLKTINRVRVRVRVSIPIWLAGLEGVAGEEGWPGGDLGAGLIGGVGGAAYLRVSLSLRMSRSLLVFCMLTTLLLKLWVGSPSVFPGFLGWRTCFNTLKSMLC